jgi:excinuclease UvrABC nuclease subunit
MASVREVLEQIGEAKHVVSEAPYEAVSAALGGLVVESSTEARASMAAVLETLEENIVGSQVVAAKAEEGGGIFAAALKGTAGDVAEIVAGQTGTMKQEADVVSGHTAAMKAHLNEAIAHHDAFLKSVQEFEERRLAGITSRDNSAIAQEAALNAMTQFQEAMGGGLLWP